MAMKCVDCGHIFDDGEQAVRMERHPYGDTVAFEYFSVCPICGGEFKETMRCKKCSGEFLENELIGGYYCEECLNDLITFDNFLDFATTGVKYSDDIDTLEDFIFAELFDVDTPKHSSSDLKEYCKELYLRKVANEKLLGQTEFMSKIHDYFYRVGNLKDDFADYLHEKEVRK